MVQYPEWIDARNFGALSLLPVNPPEVNPPSLVLMVHDIKVSIHKLLICAVEAHWLLRLWINAHELCYFLVLVFPVTDPVRRVYVQRDFHAPVMQFLEEGVGVGKQLFIPRVSCPSIFSCGDLPSSYDKMPIHVYNGNVHRDVVLFKVVMQLQVLFLVVSMVSAPPVSHGESRQQRLTPRNCEKGSHGIAIVVPIHE